MFQTITCLSKDAAVLRTRRYGVIEMLDGKLAGVHLRPWPKLISAAEIWLFDNRYHSRTPGDRCLLYYNEPLSCPGYMTLKYVVSSFGARLKTFRGALVVLDEIARIKQINATVCEAWNTRITERLLTRWGWERHVLQSRHRHYIKRFYGDYPAPAEAYRLCGFDDAKANRDFQRKMDRIAQQQTVA